MKQEIRFKGMSLDRDELATQHGELAFCGGVDLHNGSLRPSILDGTKIGAGNSAMEVTIDGVTKKAELVYVHVGLSETYPHYIGKIEANDEISFYWFDKDMSLRPQNEEPTSICFFADTTAIYSIKSVGNVLAILTSEGIHYLLFKDEGSNEYYDWLGIMPELDMQFGLSLKDNTDTEETITKVDEEIERNYSGYYNSSLYQAGMPYSLIGPDEDLNQKLLELSEAIVAKVNEVVYNYHEEGYFVFPFLVRYAFRLYDGSLTRHSAPILMMPSGSVCPFTPASGDGENWEFKSGGHKFLLSYIIPDSNQLTKLQKWSDIIKSIDIFISAPIYTYDQSGRCKNWLPISYYDNEPGATAFYRTNISSPTKYIQHTSLPYKGERKVFMELPMLDENEISQVAATANFFLYRSFSLKSLVSGQHIEIEPKTGDLTTITSKPQMTDDYDSHDLLMPKGSYIYNARLNTFNIDKIKFRGFHPTTCFNLTTNRENDYKYQVDSYVHIKSEQGTTVVHYNSTILSYSGGGIPRWFYYPDPSAFKAVWLVRCIAGVNYQDPIAHAIQIYELDLKPHPMLNGAYWFDDYKTPASIGTFADAEPAHEEDFGPLDPICDLQALSQAESSPNVSLLPEDDKPLADTNITVSLPNSVYTSKANNPFFFPNLVDESGVNTVGSGTILGMATVTRALSSGTKVGDQDLIVFASDGIWVMKVSPTGTYTNINNISREVCTGQENICELDQSVIFSTNRSINRFIESDSMSISDVLDGPNVPFTTIMQGFYNYIQQWDADTAQMITFAQDMNISMMENCKVIYDYSMRRLLALQKSQGAFTRIALVFCMADQSWSLMYTPTDIKAFIPGYPYPYYQAADGKVYVLDKPYHKIQTSSGNPPVYTPFKGAIITRTLAFSETMDVIRGYQQLCNLGTKPLIYIYGSNDQNTWKLIGYSNREFTNYLPGHPFRYFRVAMAITMTTEERYQSIVLDVINKYAKL